MTGKPHWGIHRDPIQIRPFQRAVFFSSSQSHSTLISLRDRSTFCLPQVSRLRPSHCRFQKTQRARKTQTNKTRLSLDNTDVLWVFWKAPSCWCFCTSVKALQTELNPAAAAAAAMYCFNSREKQLKAGRGLTYTQWSKIDERHPAWTNHSTEGEASRPTWKVQEAMTGLMARKMLLMNEERRLWLCFYPPLFTLLLGAKALS